MTCSSWPGVGLSAFLKFSIYSIEFMRGSKFETPDLDLPRAKSPTHVTSQWLGNATTHVGLSIDSSEKWGLCQTQIITVFTGVSCSIIRNNHKHTMKVQKNTNSYSVCWLLCSLTCKFITAVISSDFVCSKQAWVYIVFCSARCTGTNCARLWQMHRWIYITFCRGNTNTYVCVVILSPSILHSVHIHKHTS